MEARLQDSGLSNQSGYMVNEDAVWITNAVSTAVRRYTPVSKSSPYSKRWWTPELSALKKSFTKARNRLRRIRRNGENDRELSKAATKAKYEYHAAIDAQKKQHWQDFLAENSNIWKTAEYLNPLAAASFANVPALKTSHGELSTDNDIADQLLKTFFPTPAVSQR